MIIREHQSKEKGFDNLLNYAHLINEGVIINKDGAFLTAYRYRGRDINSATQGELDGIIATFNRMALMLDDGWMLHIDEIRIPSLVYPEKGDFYDSVSALIDDERRQMYESEGTHYENIQFLTFVWKFPAPVLKTTQHLFIEGLEKENDTQNLTKLYRYFKDSVERFVGLLSSILACEQLNSEDLLSFLNTCLTGELLPIAVPPTGCYIDSVLSRKNWQGGYRPKMGDKHVYVLSILGYLNSETMPGFLENISTYPMIYRWSNRFIALSEATADSEMSRYEKNWHNKVKGLVGMLKETFSGKQTSKMDDNAFNMELEVKDARTANASQVTRFGYWSSEIVLMHEDLQLLDEATKEISKYLEQLGFALTLETVNVQDAFLGTIPGHGSCNLRRLFTNAINFAHAIPLHSIWSGARCSSPSSLLPPKSPPVFYAATTGKTPFRYHTDVGDVGHYFMVGPTGAGKSTFLGFLTSQFFRYKNAHTFIFDKDYSHKGLTEALGGQYYDLGKSEELSFCPLSDLSTDSRKMRAGQFIEDLVVLQNVPITPEIRATIHTAIEAIARDSDKEGRSLTHFRSLVQHKEVRSALQYYTLDGPLKILDSTKDSLQTGRLQAFEMGWLLEQKPEIYLPIFSYICNYIDSWLEEQNAACPTHIQFEEMWFFKQHPVAKKILKNWLKVKRKQNVRIGLATQSLSDLYDPSTKMLDDIAATIFESCPTKIFLPNPGMEAETRDLYSKLGLNDKQIEIISHVGIPKRHYYIATPEGNRLIELGLSEIKPIALEFIGLSKAKSARLIECKKTQGSAWVYYWLLDNGFKDWADYWMEKYHDKV